MNEITDFSDKSLPQSIRDMLDGKSDGKALDAKGIMSDLRDLDAAKARMKALLYVEGKVESAKLFDLAADEIESLRAQVEDHIANVTACGRCGGMGSVTVDTGATPWCTDFITVDCPACCSNNLEPVRPEVQP